MLLQGHLRVRLYVHPVPVRRQRRQTGARRLLAALLRLSVAEMHVPAVSCGWPKSQEDPRTSWVSASMDDAACSLQLLHVSWMCYKSAQQGLAMEIWWAYQQTWQWKYGGLTTVIFTDGPSAGTDCRGS